MHQRQRGFQARIVGLGELRGKGIAAVAIEQFTFHHEPEVTPRSEWPERLGWLAEVEGIVNDALGKLKCAAPISCDA